MIRTVEAVVEPSGKVRLLESVELHEAHRALVTILEDAPYIPVADTALLSGHALAQDWSRAEEDEAWAHLQLSFAKTPSEDRRPQQTKASDTGDDVSVR